MFKQKYGVVVSHWLFPGIHSPHTTIFCTTESNSISNVGNHPQVSPGKVSTVTDRAVGLAALDRISG